MTSPWAPLPQGSTQGLSWAPVCPEPTVVRPAWGWLTVLPHPAPRFILLELSSHLSGVLLVGWGWGRMGKETEAQRYRDNLPTLPAGQGHRWGHGLGPPPGSCLSREMCSGPIPDPECLFTWDQQPAWALGPALLLPGPAQSVPSCALSPRRH